MVSLEIKEDTSARNIYREKNDVHDHYGAWHEGKIHFYLISMFFYVREQ